MLVARCQTIYRDSRKTGLVHQLHAVQKAMSMSAEGQRSMVQQQRLYVVERMVARKEFMSTLSFVCFSKSIVPAVVGQGFLVWRAEWLLRIK
eukprot:1461044-Amphidinium_carterae.1